MPSTRSTRAGTTGSLMQEVSDDSAARAAASSFDADERPRFETLAEAVHARRKEFVRPTNVRIKVGTWNVAAHKGTEEDIGAWFVDGKGVAESLAGLHVKEDPEREDVSSQEARHTRSRPTVPQNDPGSETASRDEIGLYVLGLQEVVDIRSPTEALRPYTDTSPAKRWKDAVAKAAPEGYGLVAEQQLLGLLLLIFASPEVAKDIRSVSTTSVGTGLMGYMGNKGAVAARLVLGDTTRLVFVDCHLAAGADKTSLERRNWDAQQIVQRIRFEPIQDAMGLTQTTGETIGDEDIAFWMGDLNYRLEGIPGDDVRRLLMLHARNEYDVSGSSRRRLDEEISNAAEGARERSTSKSSLDSEMSIRSAAARSSVDGAASDRASTAATTIADGLQADEDPMSLQTTLSSLLPHDELHQQMKTGKAFHDGWREGSITFLPTYKYDVGSVGIFDSSEKKRAPSWCDRILYRTRRDKLAYEERVREESEARKRDQEMKASGTDQAGNDEDILYDYDPDTDGTTTHDDYDEDEERNEQDATTEGVLTTREGYEDELELESYLAHQRVLSSDHKPLHAVFRLKYDGVDAGLKAQVYADTAKDLDKAENESRPNVTVVVDRHNETQPERSDDILGTFEGVWLGSVRWGQTKHRTLTIANTSRVVASFNFLDRPSEDGRSSGVAAPWLRLRWNGEDLAGSSGIPRTISLEPGETANIELEARVTDIKDVQAFNDGSLALDDILVLRVDGGRDHFIPVKAKWLETSLGRLIDKLIRVPEGGIRKLQSQRPHGEKRRNRGKSDISTGSAGTASDTDDEPVRFSAPRELFRLTEAIEKLGARVVAEIDMTSSDVGDDAPWVKHPAWPFDEDCWTERSSADWQEALSEVCNALDTDEPLDACMASDMPSMRRLYVLSDLLLLFLRSMPDGVIHGGLWSQLDAYLAECEKSKRRFTAEEQRTGVHEILSQSPSHSISFVLVMSMLERIENELCGVQRADNDQAMSPVSSKRDTLKKMATFGKAGTASRKKKRSEAWAKVFAEPIVRTATGADKSRMSSEKRKAELLMIYLDG